MGRAVKALDPRQAAFKEYYLTPESETFGNALRSAIRAGFSEDYAKTILNQGTSWVAEIIRDANRLAKAEKVLDKSLSFIDSKDVGKNRIAQDSAKFIAKTLGKHKYSERTELTGEGGSSIGILHAVFHNDSDSKDIQDVEAHPGGAGRDERIEDGQYNDAPDSSGADGQEADADERGVRELPPPEEGGDEGLLANLPRA